MDTQKKSTPVSNKTNQGISVTFNGKSTSLNPLTREEIAATDQDRMKNWREEEDARESLKDQSDEIKTPSTIKEELPSAQGPLDWRELAGPSYPTSNGPSSINKKRPPDFVLFFRKFWVPFLSAVIVGLGLGFTVLLVLSNHNTVASSEKAVTTSTAVATTSQTTNPKKESAVSGKSYILNLQVVQTGVYSSKTNAMTDKTNQSKEGVHTAVLKDGDKFALFSGLALNKGDLASLNQTLPSKLKPYDKAFVINPQKIKGTKRDLQDIKTANLVIQNLIPLSLTAIQNGKVDQSVLKQVEKALNQMEDPSAGTNQKDLVKLKGTLVAAYSALNQSTPDGQSAQNALLDALESYQTIIMARVQ